MPPPPDPIAFTIPGIDRPVFWYGILVTLGTLAGAFVADRLARRRGHNPDRVWDALILVMIFGLIGARLYHVFSSPAGSDTSLQHYLERPLDIINFWSSGLRGLGIYGAVVGGAFGLAVYLWAVNRRVAHRVGLRWLRLRRRLKLGRTAGLDAGHRACRNQSAHGKAAPHRKAGHQRRWSAAGTSYRPMGQPCEPGVVRRPHEPPTEPCPSMRSIARPSMLRCRRVKDFTRLSCTNRYAIDSATRLTLVNAIYLKAPWLTQFRSEATRPRTFTLLDGTTVDVPLMRGTQQLPYAEGAGWQAVDLPYIGGSLALTVVRPDDLDAFEEVHTPDRLSSIIQGLEHRTVALAVPKFGLETKLGLAAVLSTLGMPTAFDPAADFSGITNTEPVFIGDVIHHANIDVDENGTEAAAATTVIMVTGAMPEEPVALTVDRPFIFALRDVPTGAILFFGRVVNPAAGQ